MSDGPHKTLPMRRWWKETARVADNAAYAVEALADQAAAALFAEFRHEIGVVGLDALREVVGADGQARLFAETAVDELQQMRSALADTPLLGDLVDYARMALLDGQRGEDALIAALANALQERYGSTALQIEEHYLREAPQSRATHLRTRLEAPEIGRAIGDLARRLVSGDMPAQSSLVRREDGLDDGPEMAP